MYLKETMIIITRLSKDLKVESKVHKYVVALLAFKSQHSKRYIMVFTYDFNVDVVAPYDYESPLKVYILFHCPNHYLKNFRMNSETCNENEILT